MKNVILYVIAVAIVATSCSKLPSSNEIWYTTTDGEPIHIGYDWFDATEISNTYTFGRGVIRFDKNVTEIKEDAFYNCETLSSLTIPDSVTSIESRSINFYCKSLSAFYGKYASSDNRCLIVDGELIAFAPYGLEEYTIPNDVTKITEKAFRIGCHSLKAFYGKYASSDNRCLIVDGELVAFASCGLEEYTIPSEVIKIGVGVFSECKLLTSITIPDSVIEIGDGAFWKCELLSDLTIGSNVKKIGAGAFWSCYGLRNVDIPYSVTMIGECAFSRCEQLKSVNIPWRVTEIREETFEGCSELQNIDFHSNITKIGKRAFSCCRRLTSIDIPYSVTEIEYGAFSGCIRLEKAWIGEGVTKIGERAFDECKRLKVLHISRNVDSIGRYAFSGCESLYIVIIPDSVKEIGESAFYNCKGLRSVLIGEGVETIGADAFSRWEAKYYLEIFCKPTTPPKGADGMLSGWIKTVYGPHDSVDAYKYAEYWSNYDYDIKGYDMSEFNSY